MQTKYITIEHLNRLDTRWDVNKFSKYKDKKETRCTELNLTNLSKKTVKGRIQKKK